MPESYHQLTHPFAPVWDEDCRVLILGTFPSVQSRANAFYYGHPQNRFWRVIAAVFGEDAPATVEDKRALLLRRHLALWDVLARCDVTGSADASLRDCVPNDVAALLRRFPVRRVLANGQTAARLYAHFCAAPDAPPLLALPSTSPANAAWTLPRLVEAWKAGIDG